MHTIFNTQRVQKYSIHCRSTIYRRIIKEKVPDRSRHHKSISPSEMQKAHELGSRKNSVLPFNAFMILRYDTIRGRKRRIPAAIYA